MPSAFLWSLYSLLVVIWSSTWVAIKIGLEDLAPLFSAGVRFSLAGLVLLLFAAATGRPLLVAQTRVAVPRRRAVARRTP